MPGRASTRTAAVALGGLAGLHAAWGLGASWPLADRDALADAVIGRAEVPPAAACWAVAGALGAAAAIVGGRPRALPRLRRAGAAGVVLVLAGRGLLGLAGRTDVVSPGSSSPRFRELDRGRYSPLCLVLAGLALPATRAC
jgi:Protein of unknown function (DUF3995)